MEAFSDEYARQFPERAPRLPRLRPGGSGSAIQQSPAVSALQRHLRGSVVSERRGPRQTCRQVRRRVWAAGNRTARHFSSRTRPPRSTSSSTAATGNSWTRVTTASSLGHGSQRRHDRGAELCAGTTSRDGRDRASEPFGDRLAVAPRTRAWRRSHPHLCRRAFRRWAPRHHAARHRMAELYGFHGNPKACASMNCI